jgi:hypothetical protein
VQGKSLTQAPSTKYLYSYFPRASLIVILQVPSLSFLIRNDFASNHRISPSCRFFFRIRCIVCKFYFFQPAHNPRPHITFSPFVHIPWLQCLRPSFTWMLKALLLRLSWHPLLRVAHLLISAIILNSHNEY